jgi:hypothetical protein
MLIMLLNVQFRRLRRGNQRDAGRFPRVIRGLSDQVGLWPAR